MALDLRLVLGNGKQNLRHSVADVILHDILDEKHGDEHTDSRIDKIKEVIELTIEPRSKAVMDIQDRQFEGHCRKTA